MASQTLYDNPDYLETADIERRRRMATALQQQSLAPLPDRMVGRVAVRTSPLEGMARIAQALAGQHIDKQASEQATGLQERRQQRMADWLRGMPQGSTQTAPTDSEGTGAFDMAGSSGPTVTQQPATPQDFLRWQAQGVQQGVPQQALQVGQAGAQYAQADQAREDQQRFQGEQRKAAMEQRAHDLQARLADQRTTAQDKLAAQRELAQMQIQARQDMQQQALQGRRDMMAMTAANRAPEPLQAVLGDDGKPVLLPRSQAVGRAPATGADRPLTEMQGKSATYGSRAAQSDKILNSLEDKISVSGLAAKQAAQGVPLVGGILGALGNTALSPEQQRVEQAQRDFVNATLRQESGAAISPSEFENAKKQYFPQPGDSKDVLDQKRQNRQLVVTGFKRQAGSVAGADIEAIQNAPLLPSGGAPLPTKGSVGGGEFKVLGVER